VVLIGCGVPRYNALSGGWSGFTSSRYAPSVAQVATGHLTNLAGVREPPDHTRRVVDSFTFTPQLGKEPWPGHIGFPRTVRYVTRRLSLRMPGWPVSPWNPQALRALGNGAERDLRIVEGIR
jgi:hypothetical protein